MICCNKGIPGLTTRTGVVRIARHAKTGKYAAIKIMSKTQVLQSRCSITNLAEENERIIRAIEREIVVMKLIDHPNIMRLYDVWETSGELYLILEYIEGGELFDYIAEKGRLPEPEALDYFQQLIGAIDYCHRLNIAHRDLKPENILLTKEKSIKVADFGLAGWQCGENLLQTSCGSPHYAAPEVISGLPYDGPTADVWSCGIILYALLAGRLPFDAEKVELLLEKVRIGKFTMPSEIPPGARDLLRKMLEIEVTKRIKIVDVLKHPWFLSRARKSSEYVIPSLDDIGEHITTASEIDEDIFGNLRTLWYNESDEAIRKELMSKEKTWEKTVYFLLVKYRSRYLEEYEELERARSQRRAERKQKHNRKEIKETILERPETPPSQTSRPKAPTPRRATNKAACHIRPNSHNVPPREKTDEVSSHISRSSSSTVLPILSPTSPESPLWGALDIVPPLNVPELQDDRVQQYFQQIMDHLNTMQNTPVGISPLILNAQTPIVSTPKKSVASSSVTREEPEEDPDGTYVLVSCSEASLKQVKDKNRKHRYTADRRNEKENEGHVIKKSSLRKGTPTRRRALADRHVQIILPSPIKRGNRRLSCDSYTSQSPTFSISEASSSFNVPSAPKTWFTNLFKFRPVSFTLLSVKDVESTSLKCQSLLLIAGVRVLLTCNDETQGIFLKCQLDEVRDPAGVMAVMKAVKFRVEFHELDPQQEAELGYRVSVVMTLEKGAVSTFRLVHQRLQREWDFDNEHSQRQSAPYPKSYQRSPAMVRSY